MGVEDEALDVHEQAEDLRRVVRVGGEPDSKSSRVMEKMRGAI